MVRLFTVSGSIVVGVSPEAVYQAVSRPGDMGRWSPENLGTTADSAGGEAATLGTTFVGRNKRGRFRWVTRCTVTAADQPAFRLPRPCDRTPPSAAARSDRQLGVPLRTRRRGDPGDGDLDR